VHKFRALTSELNAYNINIRFEVLEDIGCKSFVHYSQFKYMSWNGRKEENKNMVLTFLPSIMKLTIFSKLIWGTQISK
jgi:hypothetical protein